MHLQIDTYLDLKRRTYMGGAEVCSMDQFGVIVSKCPPSRSEVVMILYHRLNNLRTHCIVLLIWIYKAYIFWNQLPLLPVPPHTLALCTHHAYFDSDSEWHHHSRWDLLSYQQDDWLVLTAPTVCLIMPGKFYATRCTNHDLLMYEGARCYWCIFIPKWLMSSWLTYSQRSSFCWADTESIKLVWHSIS